MKYLDNRTFYRNVNNKLLLYTVINNVDESHKGKKREQRIHNVKFNDCNWQMRKNSRCYVSILLCLYFTNNEKN